MIVQGMNKKYGKTGTLQYQNIVEIEMVVEENITLLSKQGQEMVLKYATHVDDIFASNLLSMRTQIFQNLV